MIDFYEVMQRMKMVLELKMQKKKILDKDVAIALQIDPQNYAVIKRRKKIPYESIAYFSKKNKLSMNWILFSQKPQYLTK
jgi:ribosomal protein S8